METPDYPHDPSQEIAVPAQALQEVVQKILVRKGMFAAEALMGAARLVEADLRGIQSHGTRALPRYVKAMDSGDIDPRGQILKVHQTPALGVMDGGRSLGHTAATKAMDWAIQLAKASGTGTVLVKNSQHFGAASVYTLMAIKQGMIGYCTTSTGPATVSAYGSRAPAVANNAFSWGFPVKSGAPFVLDMACATSSWGKVTSLGMYGQKIPAGWALDAAGNPTTEPGEAKTLLPAAGARGYGLAFVSSVLAGSLVGSRMPIHKTMAVEGDGSEHFFYVIDPAQVGSLDAYYAEMEKTIADIRQLAPAEGFDKVRVPGEMEYERSLQWAETGIPLHRNQLNELKELATKMKVAVPWTD